MSRGTFRWRHALMRYARRGKLFIRPHTAHSTAGVPFAIRFAAGPYHTRVSKRAVRRQQARNRQIPSLWRAAA